MSPGGVFRRGLPDYNSPVFLKECVFDYKGEILADLGYGGSVIYDKQGSNIKAIFLGNDGGPHI